MLGVVKTVKDVETRRKWKKGERPMSFFEQSAEDETPPPVEPAPEDGAAGTKSAADAAIDAAHATIDAAMHEARSEEAEAGASAEDNDQGPLAPVQYDPDDYHPEDDNTPAMAIAIAQPLGDGEASHEASGRSPVWGVITTPSVGKTPISGRGDPEEIMLLMELSKHVSDAKANIDRINRSGGKDVDFSNPPPPVLPLSLNPNRAGGSLVMEFGPEIHWCGASQRVREMPKIRWMPSLLKLISSRHADVDALSRRHRTTLFLRRQRRRDR